MGKLFTQQSGNFFYKISRGENLKNKQTLGRVVLKIDLLALNHDYSGLFFLIKSLPYFTNVFKLRESNIEANSGISELPGNKIRDNTENVL